MRLRYREASLIEVVDILLLSVLQYGCQQFEPRGLAVREAIRGWRFNDHFSTDSEAPARAAQIGTFSPILHHDGSNLAAALQTILEIRSDEALAMTLEDAFPGSRHFVEVQNGLFELRLQQHGLLRPLSAAELSDGTLRDLLWAAALLTPRPPEVMVLNEPETSPHPDIGQSDAAVPRILSVANRSSGNLRLLPIGRRSAVAHAVGLPVIRLLSAPARLQRYPG